MLIFAYCTQNIHNKLSRVASDGLYIVKKKRISEIQNKFEPAHEISNNVVCATSKASDQPAHTRSLIRAYASRFSKLLTEHHLEFLSLKGGCTGLSKSTQVKIPHCWKSHALAHFICLRSQSR